MTTWTDAYYGIQHLKTLPNGYQITLQDHGGFVEVYLLSKHSAHPFTPSKQECAASIQQAKAIGEKWAALL